MDRLNAMTIFVAVAEAGSLAKVARDRRISPPAVTRAIKALEDHIGVQLLNRTTHSLSLTEAGERYLASTRRILAEISDGERAVAGNHGRPTGHLRITASVMFAKLHVVPLVAKFLDAHSEISTTLVCSDRIVDLVEDSVDVAVRIGDWSNPSMRARHCGKVQRILVAAPNYLDQHPLPCQPDDLPAHQLIMFTGLVPSRQLHFVQNSKVRTVALSPYLEVNDPDAAIIAAESGLGIVQVLNYMVADQLTSGSLVQVLAEFSPPPVPVKLVYDGSRAVPAKIRAFVDFAEPVLGERLDRLAPS